MIHALYLAFSALQLVTAANEYLCEETAVRYVLLQDNWQPQPAVLCLEHLRSF